MAYKSSPPVTALILAAGFGKRLGTITVSTPKPLVDVGGVRLIELSLALLKNAGFQSVFINLHYLGQQIVDFLGSGDRYGLSINYSWEDPILDTGGAIKKVLSQNPDDPILVINSDAVFEKTLDLRKFIHDFIGDPLSPSAKMLLTPPPTPNPYGEILAGESESRLRVSQIVDAKLSGAPVTNPKEFTFTGLHIFSPRVLSDMNTLGEIFCSIRHLYPLLLSRGDLITAELFTGFWNDTGTPERLEETRKAVLTGRF